MIKEKYIRTSVTAIGIETDGSLLSGSMPTVTTVTDIQVTIPDANVTIESYQSGFTDGGSDFKDLDF